MLLSGQFFPMITPKVKWPNNLLARLGKEPDTHIAQSMGVGTWVVCAKRNSLGIPKYKIVQWVPEWIGRLGKEPDSVIARLMGASVTAVSMKRCQMRIPKFVKVKFNWTVTRTKRLGKKSDRMVAESLGLPVKMVAGKRHALGIPCASVSRWTPEILADIGLMPDLDLVRKHRYKISRAAVAAKRRNMAK